MCKWLTYRWPINRPRLALSPQWTDQNHKGATSYPLEIDVYIKKEIEYGATIGPFDNPPFSHHIVGCSPLSTCEKKDNIDHCIIMDFSWPINRAVNDFISNEFYLGVPVILKYPIIDILAEQVKTKGTSALMYKQDLKRALDRSQLTWQIYYCKVIIGKASGILTNY